MDFGEPIGGRKFGSLVYRYAQIWTILLMDELSFLIVHDYLNLEDHDIHLPSDKIKLGHLRLAWGWRKGKSRTDLWLFSSTSRRPDI